MMGYRRKILEAKKIGKKRKNFVEHNTGYVAVNRQCLKKTAYPTEKRVIYKINEIAEQGRRSLRYYQCPFCSLWHISHKAIPGQVFIS